MIAIVDYGVGNLFSLNSSFNKIGEDAKVVKTVAELKKADRIILPGVGAFSDAAKKLKESGMQEEILKEVKSGKPLMGICLGMQLLFDKSYEYGEHDGLGLIGGTVRPIKELIKKDLKIPHMGWNALKFNEPKHPLFKYINEGDCVYFVHSFAGANCKKSVIATCEYDALITAAVCNKNVLGCQFHPEKSGEVGLKILKAFCELKGDELC